LEKAVLINRRAALRGAAATSLAGAWPRLAGAEEAGAAKTDTVKPDHTLRIATGLVELAPDRIVSTTLYNGQFPGPLLRLREGQATIIDVHNDTDTPELVHWHGQMIPSEVDGAAEEGSPFVPAHGMRRLSFTPKPSGFRFYHTHVPAGGDLNRGTYTGQAGPVYIEPQHNPGAYDREIFLVLKEFSPSFSRGGDMAMDALIGAPVKALQEMGKAADDAAEEKTKDKTKGLEVGYDLFAINGRMLGTANLFASSRVSGCCSMCSTPARAKSAASRFPDIASGLSRSTAIRCRPRPMCRCSGSAPPSGSPPSSRRSIPASG
jgi:FtsP/CotA-like multicopper oxidase with cupredoxin domain